MIILLLIASIALADPIIKEGMTEEDRYKALQPYFLPPPGGVAEILSDSLANKKYKDRYRLYQGHVIVRPPKGQCFTISRHPTFPDDRVCSEKKLSFIIAQLAINGDFQWTISTGPEDYGYTYTWKTPHRISYVIPSGEKHTKEIPIKRCIPQSLPSGDKVILEMMNDERWAFTFPNKDVLTKQPPKMPNLYIPRWQEDHGGINKDSSIDVEVDYFSAFKELNKDESLNMYWTLPLNGAFEMNSSHFKIRGAPPGMHGTCRYTYKGAEKDKESGWIECHRAERYDVLFTYLPCAKALRR